MPASPLQKNQILDLTVEGYGTDAQGVCRADGFTVFAPYALPGERVRVRIVKVERRYAFGRVEAVLSPSPQRTVPPCPIYRRCGGCVAQHMRYEETLAFKRRQVRDCLARIGDISIDVPPVIGMENPWHYRNKGAYPVGGSAGRPRVGFFAPRSHDLVDLPEAGCAIQREEANEAVRAVKRWMRMASVSSYDENTHKGLVRHIMVRAARTGETMVVLAINGESVPQADALVAQLRSAIPTLTGVLLSVNRERTNVILGGRIVTLWGSDSMIDTLLGLRFRVSPLSFFQVNPEQTERLYSLALDFAQLTGSETVVDAYCGAGTISLLLARAAKRVVGIEIVPQAIADANENAARNGIENATFLVDAAEAALPRLVEEGLRPDVVMIDPPRKGCDEAVLRAIAASAPRRVVYVSCNPATLARDAALLVSLGYEPARIACVDMFCWTGAIETVMSLVQQKPDDIVKVDIDADELAVTKADSKATYGEIQARVKEQTGLNVTSVSATISRSLRTQRC